MASRGFWHRALEWQKRPAVPQLVKSTTASISNTFRYSQISRRFGFSVFRIRRWLIAIRDYGSVL
jgi:hypothetical protein